METTENLTLYRKYRPAIFDEVVGQEYITRTIRNALKSGQVSHAYLFTGPRGTGKTTVARLVAKSLNCITSPTDTPCLKCDACKAIQSGSYLDVIEIDAASNRGIDDIRSLREHIHFAPTQGGYKLYIIDEVHMLTQDASNALLKTLEEPPSKTVFILATTEKHKVLPTIQSRCQIFEFRRLPMNLITSHLKEIAEKEGFEIDDKSLATLAKKARGGLRDALVLLEQARVFSDGRITPPVVYQLIGYLSEESLADMIVSLLKEEIFDAIKALKELDGSGFDLRSLSSLLQSALSEILIFSNASVYYDDWSLDKNSLERIKEIAKQDRVILLMELLEEADKKIRYGEDPKLALEISFLRYHFHQKARPVAAQQVFEKIDSSLNVEAPAPKSASSLPISVPASTTTLNPELNQNWKAFLEKIKTRSFFLHAHLKESRFLGIENGLLKIRFPSGLEESKKAISKTENLKLINDLLPQFFRKKISLEIVESLKQPPVTSSPESGDSARSFYSPDTEAVEEKDVSLSKNLDETALEVAEFFKGTVQSKNREEHQV